MGHYKDLGTGSIRNRGRGCLEDTKAGMEQDCAALRRRLKFMALSVCRAKNKPVQFWWHCCVFLLNASLEENRKCK